MKKPCSYEYCGMRRVHWEQPFTERGTQHVEVPDDHKGPVYCSLECAMLAGAISMGKGPGSTYFE